jgi:hypothetical protein
MLVITQHQKSEHDHHYEDLRSHTFLNLVSKHLTKCKYSDSANNKKFETHCSLVILFVRKIFIKLIYTHCQDCILRENIALATFH